MFQTQKTFNSWWAPSSHVDLAHGRRSNINIPPGSRSLSPNNNPSVKRIPPVSNAESDSQKDCTVPLAQSLILRSFNVATIALGRVCRLVVQAPFFATRYSVFSVTSRKTHGKSQGFVKSNDAFPSSASLTFLDVLPLDRYRKCLCSDCSLWLRIPYIPSSRRKQPWPTSTHSTSTSTTPETEGPKWGGWGSQGQWKANCCINLANKKNKRNMAANQDKHGNHHVHPTDNLWHKRSDFLLLLRNSNA